MAKTSMWDQPWSTSGPGDMKNGSLPQLFAQKFATKPAVAADKRLDNTGVEVRARYSSAVSRAGNRENELKIRLIGEIGDQLRDNVPACAQCDDCGSRYVSSFDPKDMAQILTLQAFCKPGEGNAGAICPKRSGFTAHEVAWPPTIEAHTPKTSPDVPLSCADAW